MAVLLTLIAALILYGCSGKGEGEDDPFEEDDPFVAKEAIKEIDDETMRQINTDYLILHCGEEEAAKYDVDLIRFDFYFGVFNGWYVFAEPSPISIAGTVSLAGYDFYFSGGAGSVYWIAWKDGEIYWIKEAYEKGIITKKNVKTMYNRHGNGLGNTLIGGMF